MKNKNLTTIEELAMKLGFSAQGVRNNLDKLTTQPKPNNYGIHIVKDKKLDAFVRNYLEQDATRLRNFGVDIHVPNKITL